ncbi:hemin ABC transporter substrate-binding protein [Loktanella agnita]|uniref:heme/hemin ABC transporter substrate-binding protein n=1 Tax=Loktanella agnita TaxID=287097 RepID=UPI003986D5D3
MRMFSLLAAVLLPTALCADGAKNVLSIGGSVTEIIYALGEGDRLIARDSTSGFPVAAAALPDVGYMRALSPEGVLAVSPGLIISEEGAGPPETIAVLESANIPFITVPDEYSRAGIIAKVRAVGDALDVSEVAQTLVQDLDAKLQVAEKTAQNQAGDTPKRVLFILSTQGGRIMASGQNTAAHGIITMAGAMNVITEFEGYKPLSDEAISAAAPDVILMMDRTDDHGAANEVLFAMPALAGTPAAQNDAVVRMDGAYLLGFGPRTADAILDLNAALYGG